MKISGQKAGKTTAAAFMAVFLAVLSVFLIVRPDPACAQPIADSPCDYTNYYPSLEARAWLEAQREITQNQNLIFKPDSVLEYTCFDRFANVLAATAIAMFSETNRWDPVMLPNDSMDLALRNLISAALDSYLTDNFDHDFLGGRMAGSDHTPAPIAGGAYNCDVMNRVWEAAKCMNFINNNAEDGFFTFAEYRDQDDKRFLPNRCAGLGGAGGLWDTNMTMAGLNVTAAPPALPPWTMDTTVTYLGWMDPNNCNDAAYPPIETGIIVNRPAAVPGSYTERVCVIPGCHYEPPAGGGAAMGTCEPP